MKTDKKLFTFMVVTSIVLAFLVLATGIMVLEFKGLNDRVDNLIANGTVSEKENIITSADTITPVDDTDTINDVVGKIAKGIASKRLADRYMPVYNTGTEDIAGILITNTKGEAISQDSDGTVTVFMNDGNTVYYGSNIVYGTDVTVLDQISYANDGVLKGYTILKDAGEGNLESGEYFHEYVLDIGGWDNVEKVFSQSDEGFGKDFVEALKGSVSSSVTDVDTSYTTLRYAIILDKDGNLAAASSYYYFGIENRGGWEDCYSSWSFESFIDIEHWELKDDWYTYDYNKMSESDGSDLTNMLQTLRDDVEPKIEAVAESEGYEITNSDSLFGNDKAESVDESRPHVHNDDGTVTYLDENEQVKEDEHANDEINGIDESRPHVHNADGTVTYLDENEQTKDD